MDKQCVRCGRAGHDSCECPWPIVKLVGRNTQGRDFIVGDIHGCFSRLTAHLGAIGFDPDEGDRLFSVGDLVDRGPECESALKWLEQPWFFAVAGNHEDMAIRWPNGNMDASNYMANGGTWNVVQTRDQSLAFADAFAKLPVAIELETAQGIVGIVHAGCPLKSWSDFVYALEDPYMPKSKHGTLIDAAQWDRSRIQAHDDGFPTLPVDNVRAVVVGHTPLREPTWCANVLHIDTAGWHPSGAGFTVIDAETLSVVHAREAHESTS